MSGDEGERLTVAHIEEAIRQVDEIASIQGNEPTGGTAITRLYGGILEREHMLARQRAEEDAREAWGDGILTHRRRYEEMARDHILNLSDGRSSVCFANVSTVCSFDVPVFQMAGGGVYDPPIANHEDPSAKAHALLLETIGQNAYVEFMRRGWIKFSNKYDWYMMLNGTTYRKTEVGTVVRLCVDLGENCPKLDKVVAFKMMIENNEEELKNEANVTKTMPLKDFNIMLGIEKVDLVPVPVCRVPEEFADRRIGLIIPWETNMGEIVNHLRQAGIPAVLRSRGRIDVEFGRLGYEQCPYEMSYTFVWSRT